MKLAAHSRLWIFQSDRKLNEADQAFIHQELKQFIQGWASHGNELYGEHQILYDYFLLIGADESKSPTSGCSIDALTRKIKAIGESRSIDFFNRLNTVYEDPSTQMHLVGMDELKLLLSDQKISENTIVYNNLINKVGDLENQWRVPLKQSWHKNLIATL